MVINITFGLIGNFFYVQINIFIPKTIVIFCSQMRKIGKVFCIRNMTLGIQTLSLNTMVHYVYNQTIIKHKILEKLENIKQNTSLLVLKLCEI